MESFAIEKGTKICVGKRAGFIDQHFLNTGKLNIKLEDGSDFTLATTRLMKLYNEGTVVFGEPSKVFDPQTRKSNVVYIDKKLTDAERSEIDFKKSYVDACVRNGRLAMQDDCELLVREHALARGDEKCPATRTVRRWAYRFLATDNARSLLDRNACKGNRQSKLPKPALDLLATFVRTNYLRRNGEHAQQVCDRINHEIRQNPDKYGVPSISYTTVRRYISSLPEILVVRKRAGHKKAKNEFTTGLHRDDAQSLLEWVEIDQTQLNIYVTNDKGEVIGRPWLTIAIDRKSRMVLWFHLSMKRLDGNALPRICYMAMRPKDMDALRQQYPDIKSEWPVHGIFQETVLDNSLENHTEDFQNICADILSMQMHYVPPAQGSDKAHVERLFRYIKESFVTTFPGSYTKDDEDKFALRAAVLTFEELEQRLAVWILDLYHNRRHSELNMSPLEKWKECIALCGSTRLPSRADDFERLLWRSESAVLQKWGLQFEKLRFKSPELAKIGDSKGHGKIRLNFYYNPYDLSSIRVVHPTSKELMEVPCSYAEYRTKTVTFEEHLEVKGKINADKKLREMNPESAYSAAFTLLYKESNAAHKRSNANMRKAKGKKKGSTTETMAKSTKQQPPKKATAADFMRSN